MEFLIWEWFLLLTPLTLKRHLLYLWGRLHLENMSTMTRQYFFPSHGVSSVKSICQWSNNWSGIGWLEVCVSCSIFTRERKMQRNHYRWLSIFQSGSLHTPKATSMSPRRHRSPFSLHPRSWEWVSPRTGKIHYGKANLPSDLRSKPSSEGVWTPFLECQ